MKHILFLFLVSLSLNLSTQKNQLFIGSSAANLIKEAKVIRVNPQSDIPSYIEFAKDKEPSDVNFETYINKLSKTKIELTVIKTEIDNIGHSHTKYQQQINGIPVEHAIYIAHIKNGKVYAANGQLYTKKPNTSSPSLNFNQALILAKKYIGATTYKWEIEQEETFLKLEQNNPQATYKPQEIKTYIAKEGVLANGIKIAYKVDIYAQKPLSRTEVYIDGNTGEVLFENDLIHTADDSAKAISGYSDTVDIVTDSINDSTYVLRENNRLGVGGIIETFDMNRGQNHASAIDFSNDSTFWNIVNSDYDEYAIDAHYGAEKTFDYYFQVHGRNSLDNAGFPLRSYIHFDSAFVNAFWDGIRMTYGDGDTARNFTPLTSMSIAGHEVTHGLVTNTAGLIYRAESGALNESFADIFGVSIDFWSRPTKANWLLGDEITTNANGHFRSMEDPNAKNDPDTYQGNFWHTSASDNFGVHTNSGVQNYWYYLLVNGGTGTNDLGNTYNVPALGFNRASAIAFRNLTVYLTPNSQYADARFYSIQSAIDLYGNCSPEVEAVTKAWYAVGIGNDYTPTTLADFSSSDTSDCRAPLAVQFTNLSNNGNSFIWDFGDGSTSTSATPSHTYTSLGSYSVRLIVDGGICGIDTLLRTNYINIIDNDTCPVPFIPNNSITLTECSGVLVDDGGKNAPYSPNQDSYVTIAPTNASTVTLTIDTFNVEDHPSCNYDYLQIFDGPDQFSPSLGVFCNATNPPPATITSSGSAITIYFHSDPGLELEGFEIQWNCQESTVGITEKESILTEKIYPNPTNSYITLEGAYSSNQNLTITLTDALSKVYYQKQLNDVSNVNQLIDLNQLAKGTYFLTVNNRFYKIIRD